MNRTALIATTLFAIGTAGAAIDDPVRLDTGMISGATTSSPDVRAFKGIPYAAPPVGDLRWRAPKPAAHWEGTRAADQFGPVCMQGGNQKMSEDCLYLNVWTGAKAAGEKRPVMLWIYGGGYTNGSGSQPMYDGEALAKKGAVVVTFNYRLGVFGFFSHPELTKESDRRAAANFGVMDSIAALRLGATEHRAIWWRPEARHHLRRIGGRRDGGEPDDHTLGEGPVRARDRREQRLVDRKDRPIDYAGRCRVARREAG